MRGVRLAINAFALTVTIVILAAFIGPAALAEVKLPVPTVDQSAVARRGFFYVGGHYLYRWATFDSSSPMIRTGANFALSGVLATQAGGIHLAE